VTGRISRGCQRTWDPSHEFGFEDVSLEQGKDELLIEHFQVVCLLLFTFHSKALSPTTSSPPWLQPSEANVMVEAELR